MIGICKYRERYWFANLIQKIIIFELVLMFYTTNQSKNADCKRDRFEIKSPFCILWTGPRRISSTQSSWLSLKQTTLLTFLKIQTRRYNRSNHDLPWIKILYNLAKSATRRMLKLLFKCYKYWCRYWKKMVHNVF